MLNQNEPVTGEEVREFLEKLEEYRDSYFTGCRDKLQKDLSKSLIRQLLDMEINSER